MATFPPPNLNSETPSMKWVCIFHSLRNTMDSSEDLHIFFLYRSAVFFPEFILTKLIELNFLPLGQSSGVLLLFHRDTLILSRFLWEKEFCLGFFQLFWILLPIALKIKELMQMLYMPKQSLLVIQFVHCLVL